jgi:hypothetical protein
MASRTPSPRGPQCPAPSFEEVNLENDLAKELSVRVSCSRAAGMEGLCPLSDGLHTRSLAPEQERAAQCHIQTAREGAYSR